MLNLPPNLHSPALTFRAWCIYLLLRQFGIAAFTLALPGKGISVLLDKFLLLVLLALRLEIHRRQDVSVLKRMAKVQKQNFLVKAHGLAAVCLKHWLAEPR
jgi:hypothetical protein